MSKRIIAVVIAAVLVAAGCSEDEESPSPPPGSAAAVAPAELTPCEVPKIPTAKCGSITVPLDRGHPEAGRTKVGFALVPRTDQANPSLGTVVGNPRRTGHRTRGPARPPLRGRSAADPGPTRPAAHRPARSRPVRPDLVEVKDAGHTPTTTPEGAKLVMAFITQDRP